MRYQDKHRRQGLAACLGFKEYQITSNDRVLAVVSRDYALLVSQFLADALDGKCRVHISPFNAQDLDVDVRDDDDNEFPIWGHPADHGMYVTPNGEYFI